MKKLFLFKTLLLCSTAFAAVDFSNLNSCVDDVKHALASPETVMLFTTDYNQLMAQLNNPSVQTAFPAVYLQAVVNPFINYLQKLGVRGFASIFNPRTSDSQAQFLQQIIPDIAEAVLQNSKGYAEKATDAFQEVVNDLYDGFLSEEDRVSNETGLPIKPPDQGVLPGIVKWGNPDA